MQILNQTQVEKLDNKSLLKYSQFVGTNARKWKNHFIATLPEIAKRGIYKKKFASITEYSAKVGGVGKKTVRSVFQVDKKLEDKPVLKELIPTVGINKVRVVATVATKENQKDLTMKIKTMSKSALEEIARNVGAAKKREVDAEHSGCCAYPGCNKPSTQLHHPDRYAITKSHNRIVPLCKMHHELAHQGLIENEDKPPDQWFIKKNPDRSHPKYKIDQKVIGYRICNSLKNLLTEHEK